MLVASTMLTAKDAARMEHNSSLERAASEKVAVTGNYSLQIAPLPESVTAYDTITVTYTLQGVGAGPYPESVIPNDGKRHFVLQKESLDKGDFHKRIYRYLIVAEKGLEIPAVKLKAYDPQHKRHYQLYAPAKKVAVHFVPRERRIDTANSLPVTALPEQWHRWVGYLAFFVAGYFTLILIQRTMRKERKRGQRSDFIETIARSDAPAQILKSIIAYDSAKFADEIAQLEEMLYGRGDQDMESIKKEIIRKGKDAA